MLLVKITTNSYLTFVFVVECIFIIAMYKYILENSQDDNYILAVFTFLTIGIYELGMSAMRQWMAGSLFLISLKYVKEKNFLKYFILIFLAGFIHISAWALILVYPFINIDISFKRKTIFFCSLTGLLMILTSFRLDFKFATIIIPNFVYKYPVFDPNLLSNYTIPIISLSCFVGIMVFYKKYKNYSKSWEFELTYLLLLICVSFVATTSMFFGRFLQYFLPALVLIIPNIINMFKGNMNKILKSVAIFFLLAIYIM